MLRRNFYTPSASSSRAVFSSRSFLGTKNASSSSSSLVSYSPSTPTFTSMISSFRAMSTASSSASAMKTGTMFTKFASFSSSSRFYTTNNTSTTSQMFASRRFNSTSEQKQQQQKEGEQQQKEGEQQTKNAESEQAKTEQAKPEENKGPGGISGHINGIKADIKQFPDIYNWQNMLSLAFFTIFCLSSTGTQVEADWWLKHWAIDSDSHFRPWSILFHSLHMNNFLSMVFAILVLHNSLHPLVHGLAGGSAALLQYCGLVSILSGLIMWAGNYAWYGNGAAKDVATGKVLQAEKQFGPWDIAAAVLLMQYLRLGIPPHRFLFSFNGWVKYACSVGGVCILYYDPQPVVCGAALGFLFCKFAPAFRGIAAAV